MEIDTTLAADMDFSQCDYPAAHSMDTTWFAVDKDGFVAVMQTEEEGALPLKFRDDAQQSGDEFLEEVAKLTGLALKFNQYDSPLPESVGLYSYSCELDWPEELSSPEEGDLTDNGEFAGTPPYKRHAVPENPLHVSALSEQIKSHLRDVVFHDVSFKAANWLQPALKVPCELWMERDYKCIDEQGKVVNVPAEFCPPGMAVGASSVPEAKPQPAPQPKAESMSASDLLWKTVTDTLSNFLRGKK